MIQTLDTSRSRYCMSNLPLIVVVQDLYTAVVRIQQRKHVLDHVDSTATTRRRELDPTDQNLSPLKYLDHEVGIGDQSNVVSMVDSGMKHYSWTGRHGQDEMKLILAVSRPQQWFRGKVTRNIP